MEIDERKFKLFDDEQFTLEDSIKRELVFRPIDCDEPLFTETHRPKNIIVLNLTKQHFKEGATKFSDMTDDAYNLVNTFFSALTFTLDKKSRLSVTLEEKRKKAVVLGETDPQQQQQQPQEQQEKGSKFLNGNEFITVYIETLMEEGFKVCGYRLWVFDRSVECTGHDLLTKGLREALLESRNIQDLVEKKMEALDKRGQGRKKQGVNSSPKISREYQFTQINTDNLFLNLVKSYFTMDDHLTESTFIEKDSDLFVDYRQFFTTESEKVKIDHEFITMSSLFGKEQSMIYHVEGITMPIQSSLTSYFSLSREEIEDSLKEVRQNRKDPMRLQNLFNTVIKDQDFKQFPFPTTSYRIDNSYLSSDLFFNYPLPHHMGSFLYTSTHREEALSKIRKSPPTENSFSPLGLHDVEYEITSDVLHQYPDYLNSELKKFLNGSSKSAIPVHSRDLFISRVRGDVEKAVLNVKNNVRSSKKNYLEEISKKGKSQKFTATTPASIIYNRDKQHVLDRRIYQEVGGNEESNEKELQKMLSVANLSFFRPRLSKYRPVEPTIENVLKVCGQPKYDKQFMEDNVYLILHSLNEYGYQQIDQKYFDPNTKKIRRGKYVEYVKEKRAFLEAILIEFWEQFFISEKVSRANKGIRGDLLGNSDPMNAKRSTLGLSIPMTNFNIQARPYHCFKLWVYSYFTERGEINHHYKTMNTLFFAKFHHCRAYSPNAKDPKLNIILSGQGMAGKSHRLGFIKDSCPTDCAEGITKWTNEAYNINGNMNDMLDIQEEMSNKLVGSAHKPGQNGISESANDDARNNYKERATSNSTTTLSFYFDEETGERRARLSKCQCQCVILGATNNDLTDADSNVLSRFIVISVPRSKNDSIGNRPQDKTRPPLAQDSLKNQILTEQQREIHRIYFIVESLIKSGVLNDTIFGVNVDSAYLTISRILDIMQSDYGIATNDIRKRKHVLELARCMCISYAVWFGLTSPTTRHLFYDPYTNEYIGFNPRVLLDGIIPHLVITKDMVIDSLTSLSCLWGHEYMDKILENITVKMCGLDILSEDHFVRKSKDANDDGTALPSHVNMGKQSRYSLVGVIEPNNDDYYTDYNYVTISSKSQAEMYHMISSSLGGDLCVAPNDISKILRDLSRTYIETDGYVKESIDGIPKLVRSKDEKQHKKRKVVDFGKNILNNSSSCAISVAFLKQKLPHILSDDIIEDLVHINYHRNEIQLPEILEIDNDMIIEDKAKEIRGRLLRAIVIDSGGSNETSMIKSIRKVYENDTLELDPHTSREQEEANFKDYADVHTGKVPWFTLLTAEHPQPLAISSLFPEYMEEYEKIPGHNKEILLVDKLSVIQLERKSDAQPFMIYNYNTIAPSAQSTLSVFQEDNEEFREINENETDLEIIEAYEEMYYLRDQKKRLQDITKNRFKLYSETAVITVDQDLDYLSCADHLRNIGYPYRNDKNRLVNYPPHVYMDLVDQRDKSMNTGEIIPLYADIMERINVTRLHIEGKIGRLSEKDTTRYSSVVNANYEEEDMIIDSAPSKTFHRRCNKVREIEAAKTKASISLYNGRYKLNNIHNITPSRSDVMTRPMPSTSKKTKIT